MKYFVVPCAGCGSRNMHMKHFTKTCRDCGLHQNKKKVIVKPQELKE